MFSTKVPVFPNWYPYNNMVFDNHLQVGNFAVKTRSWNWDYRGPVLFYTSGRVAHQAVEAYGYQRDRSNHKVIIGVADLVNVRELTNQEGKKMVCNFNNISPAKLKKILAENGYTESDSAFWVSGLGYIEPFRIGFFFQNLRRFTNAVSFNWPAGPVKPIFTNIESRGNRKLLEEMDATGFRTLV